MHIGKDILEQLKVVYRKTGEGNEGLEHSQGLRT